MIMTTKNMLIVCILACVSNIAVAEPALMISPVVQNQSDNELKLIRGNEKIEISAEQNLLVRSDKAFNIDFLDDDKNVAAISFYIDVDAGVKLNLAGCMAGLPNSHTGVCKQIGDQVRVAVFSLDNAPIPTGRIGTILTKGARTELVVKNSSFSDSKGNAVSADVL